VPDERHRLVPQQRNAMLGDAAQFSVCDVVSHGCISVGIGDQGSGIKNFPFDARRSMKRS
jgi:hypothetical protein